MSLKRAAFALSSMLACSPALADAADAVPFIPHRAVYELSLAGTTGDKAPANVQGRIAYEFSGSACDGYVTNFRQVTDLQPADGSTRTTDMRSTTFEDGSAKNFHFKIETKVDDAVQEDLEGSAKRADDGSLAVDLGRPQAKTASFPAGVVFPTEHLQRIIAAARAGERTLSIKTFDGSDTGTKLFDTFTVIGKELDTPTTIAAGPVKALENVKHWPVSISYFDVDKIDGAPSYVLAFELYENGVSGSLTLDYGDFVLSGKLDTFEPLSITTCKK